MSAPSPSSSSSLTISLSTASVNGDQIPFSTSPPEVEFPSESTLRAMQFAQYFSVPRASISASSSSSSSDVAHHAVMSVSCRKELLSSDPYNLIEQFVSKYFEQVRGDKHLLKEFFEQFPLGADLHNHLCGAIWSEDWLRLANLYQLFFRQDETFSFSRTQEEGFSSVKVLTADENLRDRFASICSMSGAKSDVIKERCQHFFRSFHCFESIASCVPLKAQLESYLKKALLCNMDYVELMVDVIDFKTLAPLPEDYLNRYETEDSEALLELLKGWVDEYRQQVSQRFNETERVDCQELLSKGFRRDWRLTDIKNPVVVRYIVDVSRLYDNPQFFAAIYAAIALCQSDSRFVGFTISGPEHDYKAVNNFRSQMGIIKELSTRLNFTNINLHAGELVKTLAEPEALTSHIGESIEARSKRIGHAACLSDSRNWRSDLIPRMVSDGICVEVCVSSNKQILNLKNGGHPINHLRTLNVPFVLCTDDAGVNRSELKDEFRKVAKEYKGFDYQAFKKLSLNSVSYSFLPGLSIYEDRQTYRLLPLFNNLTEATEWKPTPEQNEFLKANDKARMEARLLRKFVSFENITVPKLFSVHNQTQINS